MIEKQTIIYIIDCLGFGEINLPVQFAKQLPEDRYENFFILPREQLKYLPITFPYTILGPDLTENMRTFDQLLQTKNVVTLILSTYYEFSLENRFSLDWVNRITIPVATFLSDYFNMENDRTIYNGLPRKKQELRAIPARMHKLCCVPKLDQPQEPYTHFFFAYPELRAPTPEHINSVRAELGVPDDGKLIFFPVAKWCYYQSLLDHNKALYFTVGKLIQRILATTGEKVFVIHVADFPMLKNPVDPIQLHCYKSLPQADFNRLAFVADLILNLNPTSPIISTSIAGQIPMLSLVNHDNNFNEESRACLSPYEVEQTRIFPFTIFPLGRVVESAQLLTGTAIEGALVQAELQHIQATSQLLKNLLHRQGAVYDRMLAHYHLTLKTVAAMPTAETVLHNIVGGCPC